MEIIKYALIGMGVVALIMIKDAIRNYIKRKRAERKNKKSVD